MPKKYSIKKRSARRSAKRSVKRRSVKRRSAKRSVKRRSVKRRSIKKRRSISKKRSYQKAGGMLQKLGLKKATKKSTTSENLINFRRSMRVQELQDEIDNITEKMNITMNLNDLPRLNLALKRLEKEKADIMEDIYKSTKQNE